MPPARPLHVAALAFPGVQILDVVGPLEVFGRTSRWLDEHRLGGRRYTVEILGLAAGPLPSSSGPSLVAERAYTEVRGGVDTLLVAGGQGTAGLLRERRAIAWLGRMAGRVRRLGSVCTGAFALAEAGLLDGHRATTHWGYCAELGRRYPKVRVESDPIFVKSGKILTSAGVTAGMDLALSLVEEDHGRDVALHVARELVLFLRRPGGQSQFSAQLSSQLARREPLQAAQSFALEHLASDLSIAALSRRAAMSPRNFSRAFAREVGVTPAAWVERARVEAARRMLEESSSAVESIAAEVGFGSPESMRRAFLRSVGVPPRAYREHFRR